MSENGDVRLAGERYGRAILAAAYRATGMLAADADAKALETARLFKYDTDGTLTTDVAAMAAAVSKDTKAEGTPSIFAQIREAAAKRNAEAANRKAPDVAARFGMAPRR